jgi:cell division protein FtsL
MAALTNCRYLSHSRRIIRPRPLICLICLALLLSAMALGQVYLRFLSRDLQIETRKLQGLREELQNRRKALSVDIERLKSYETIRAHAEEKLGLSECLPEQSRRAIISGEAMARWSDTERIMADLRPADADRQNNKNVIAALGQKALSFSSVSMALDDGK